MDLSFEALRPGYEAQWKRICVPGGVPVTRELSNQVHAILAPPARARFEKVESMTGVPWFVTGIILTREAGSPPNFHAWLHNGDPMFDHDGNPRRTVNVPEHRPANPDCSWESGCVDAYHIDGLIHRAGWCPAFVAWVLESFNGFGYRTHHNMPSPYVWGSTVVQTRGKYGRDHQFDPNVMDTQIGGMALLWMLMDVDPSVTFPGVVA
jgi:lysozyme family protein